MADGFVQLSNDGPGKKLDSSQLTVGANTVLRERDVVADPVDAAGLERVRNTDPTLADYGGVTRPIQVVSPVRDVLSGSALAAGASVDLDGTTIAASKTGKLMEVVVSSSAACKWIVKTRDGGIELNQAVLFTSAFRPTYSWKPADKRFSALMGNGIDENFRITATNLDARNAADVYATILWDEV